MVEENHLNQKGGLFRTKIETLLVSHHFPFPIFQPHHSLLDLDIVELSGAPKKTEA